MKTGQHQQIHDFIHQESTLKLNWCDSAKVVKHEIWTITYACSWHCKLPLELTTIMTRSLTPLSISPEWSSDKVQAKVPIHPLWELSLMEQWWGCAKQTYNLVRWFFRDDTVEFINRERPHGLMWLKFWCCWCLFVPFELLSHEPIPQ